MAGSLDDGADEIVCNAARDAPRRTPGDKVLELRALTVADGATRSSAALAYGLLVRVRLWGDGAPRVSYSAITIYESERACYLRLRFGQQAVAVRREPPAPSEEMRFAVMWSAEAE